ncbi:DUF4334 domain-containing protein [Halopseudomonas salegens]|uniref:GXWXG protein n=1 Tax=Halopseudomonas salegens TaxID=1434072 RepID=A0A1H2HJC4_9GAMM|nr:DUF4334 domain-containing protein [Halopseudomonas salegens]SDU31945.1 GXWXG protein [Halopseudomonas salegens]
MLKKLTRLTAVAVMASATSLPLLADSPEEQLLAKIESGEAYSVDTLMPLFKQLEPVDLDFMLGSWKGGKFDGGEPDPINWYGKRFTSPNDVEPLLVRDDEGQVVTYDKLGAAQMRMMEFDGVSSAALIYDRQPIMDYFRKINDDVIIGLGDIKGQPLSFFFWLEREAAD